MDDDRNVIFSRGLLSIVHEQQMGAKSGGAHSLYHVELEGEGVLHTFRSLEMALFALEAISDTGESGEGT